MFSGAASGVCGKAFDLLRWDRGKIWEEGMASVLRRAKGPIGEFDGYVDRLVRSMMLVTPTNVKHIVRNPRELRKVRKHCEICRE